MRRRNFLAGLGALGTALVAACSSAANELAESSPSSPAATGPATTGRTSTGPASTGPASAGRATTGPATTGPATTKPSVVAPAEVPDSGWPLGDEPFGLGVASGDPDHQSVVIWTRLLPLETGPDIHLGWDISLQEDFSDLVGSGIVTAAGADALSVRVIVDGLEPATRYYYRFRTSTSVSGSGRTQTMPGPDATPNSFKLAVSSCQFRGDNDRWDQHRQLADDDEVDLVLWLGDFIYEGRSESLAEYRGLYENYRSDERLQASSAAHPWVITWDDHEYRNDYDAADSGDRRLSAYRAWWEHMPTRLPRPDSDGLRVYRSLDIGKLARLIVLDCRQYQSAATVLGAEQLDWLEATVRHDARHTLLGSPVLVSSLGIPDLTPPYGFEAHPADQARVVEALRNAPSPLVLSGDLHLAMELEVAPGIPELMAPPLSSALPERFVPFVSLLPLVVGSVRTAAIGYGYLIVRLEPDSIQSQLRLAKP